MGSVIIRRPNLLRVLLYTWYTAVWQDGVRRLVFELKNCACVEIDTGKGVNHDFF